MFEFVKDYFENCRSKQDAYTTQIMKGESLHPSFGPVVDLFWMAIRIHWKFWVSWVKK